MVTTDKPATAQQLASIEELGRRVGLLIKPKSIRSQAQAESVIASLLLMRSRALHYNR